MQREREKREGKTTTFLEPREKWAAESYLNGLGGGPGIRRRKGRVHDHPKGREGEEEREQVGSPARAMFKAKGC